MGLKKILAAAVLLLAATHGFAQCNFKTDKDAPGCSFIKTSVGPKMLQWQFWIGKSTTGSDLYLWMHIVEGGNYKYSMNSNDKVTFEFEDGDKIVLSPEGVAKAKIYFDGSLVTSTYPVKLKVDRAMMEKLQKVNLKKVRANIEDRDARRDVKDRTVDEIKAAAACVLG